MVPDIAHPIFLINLLSFFIITFVPISNGSSRIFLELSWIFFCAFWILSIFLSFALNWTSKSFAVLYMIRVWLKLTLIHGLFSKVKQMFALWLPTRDQTPAPFSSYRVWDSLLLILSSYFSDSIQTRPGHWSQQWSMRMI